MKISKVLALSLAGTMVLGSAMAGAQDSPASSDNNQSQNNKNQTQNQTQNQRQNRNTAGNQTTVTGERADWKNADQHLAARVAIGNQEEIAVSKMAQDQVQNEEVKMFAKMMIDEHQAYLKELEKFTPEASRTSLQEAGAAQAQRSGGQGAKNGSLERTSTRKPGVDQAVGTDNESQTVRPAGATVEGRSGAAEMSSIDPLQLEREIAQECLNSTKVALEQKEGKELDKCFIGFQIAKHAAMKAQLTVFERHASEELAPVLAKGAQTAEKHLKEAEEILETLSAGDSRVERKEERRENREERRDKN